MCCCLPFKEMAASVSGRTFELKGGLKIKALDERNYINFTDYLYKCKPVKQQQGRVLVQTNPTEQHQDAHIINPRFSNGFVGAVYRAYNEHLHLVLRPDDVWLAITAGFGLFMSVPENAELMRKHFVNHEGKIKLEVCSYGTIYTVNWNNLINRMSDLIEKNTKGDARSWIEPNFSTTTSVARTVGQVVLMGVMKRYFDYRFIVNCCGLPKVTLEGTEEDWQQLQQKAHRFATFGVDCLTHWAGLLDVVLQKLVDSRAGHVDKTFWSKVVAQKSWGSGSSEISGWVNVFMPFTKKGAYRLDQVKPETSDWGQVDRDGPSSVVEVPVTIVDNGREYKTIFYGGHLVCLYKATDNTIRPSLDWAMIDVTGSPGPQKKEYDDDSEPVSEREKNYNPQAFPKPANFSYGA